jgi:hypothetical protein
MARRQNHNTALTAQGIELIDRVIARVRADPRCIAGFCGDHPLEAPYPLPAAILNTLTFPSGQPLPPSLKHWLAFDASWLAGFGWFSSRDVSGTPGFSSRRLDEIVHDEFAGDEDVLGAPWGQMYEPLGAHLAECFLLPGGSDSRRIYAVTEQPDGLGEYPVLVVDVDDLPYAAVMYPGFDVFMADAAGFDIHPYGTYEDLFDDQRYAARMEHHARLLFGGKRGIEVMDEEWGYLDGLPDDDDDDL